MFVERNDEPAANLKVALEYVRGIERRSPEIALVLGSGLGRFADALEEPTVIPTESIPGYPVSTVPGHAGRLVFGRLEGKDVLAVQGRVHYYEGHSIRATTFPIRLANGLGAGKLVVTNAAGGINRTFPPGTLMFITDHISLAFANPLTGPNEEGGPRFPDMSMPYDESWLGRAEAEALARGVATRRGVYVWTSGPSYETKAEIRFFERIGADAVGMSTVPEVIQARYLGMKVLGLSTITNAAAGLSAHPLSHEEVMEVGRRMVGELERLLRGIVSVS